MQRPILATATLAFTLACTNGPEAEDEAGTTTSPSSSDDDDSMDDESPTTTGTSGDDDATVGTGTTSTSDGDVDDNDDSVFLPDADEGGEDLMCDSFQQDCPEGEKCVPYASSGAGWDALKCVPVLGDQAAGEPCIYDGLTESTDDCDATSWCFAVDENGNGTCHLFCGGSEGRPDCPPMSACTISGAGVVNICIATCDPVAQDCPDGSACYWTTENFLCGPTTEDVPTGEGCTFVNDCAEGNICVDAMNVPDCDGPSCCAEFCDLELGDSQCAALPGTVCAPFFEPDMIPPEYAHVGVCILPP
jgi:hypothetical protein